MKNIILISLIATTFMFACNNQKTAQNQPINYPETAKCDTCFNVYFGDSIAEPYAWLEDDTSPQTEQWVTAQNVVTQNYLAQIPYREELKKRMTDLVNYEKFGTPFVKNGKYYFFKNDGLQNQNVLYEKNTLDGDAQLLLDPNVLSDDGTVALKGIGFSNDGKYMSYSISRSGSDWEEIYVMDLATKKLADDKIEWAKFPSVSWYKDGFFYSAYDAPTAKGKEFSNVNENQKVYYHKIGTTQKSDMLVYQNKNFPKRFYGANVPDEENAIFFFESGFNNGNRMFVKSLTKQNAPIIEIASDDQYEYSVVEMTGDNFYIFTNYNAPKYRLMMGDIKNPKIENWVDVIPESEHVLTSAGFTNGKIIATYDQDATTRAYVLSTDGKQLNEILFPTFGSASFSYDKKEKNIFYSFNSFSFPNTIYKYDITNNKSEIYIEPKVDFVPENYITEQHFYTSKDGTKVSMYLVYKKGLKKNGNNPTLLYGYGGFNITYRPTFSTFRIPFLDNGGVYAIANIRGGGEYGEEWHIAGTKMQKQNVFDDFIAAGEYLISEKFTSKEKLAVLGGSNGGLLIGAVVNQRPDLFKVAIPEVGVMDMLRYHKFTIGWNWASDYGTSEDSKEMFEYLKSYSPLHNIKNDGTPYPAILITTADHDDRVVPAHSFKYAATLQAANTGDAPKIIRIDTKAGHGGGKPISKAIDEQADVYSFIMWNLGINKLNK
ncbi:MAG: prolyl oligopeptidase family serine peptidase [Paludibacter sp.]|nr:prolyl oligopeptidase family serine peptidase [Paludibacter sp.]